MYYQPEVIYRELNVERKNSILRYIGNRVLRSNKNFLCAVVGQTGSGKSWTSIAMCEDYSQMYNIPFDPRIHVISSLKQLLELIVNKELQRNIQIGTPLVFEEPQVEHSADEWQSELNKMLNVVISTFRNQRLVIFFALPYLNMLPKKSRILFHAEFRVLGFDSVSKTALVKPRFLEYNQDMDKFYRKRLLVRYKVANKRKYVKQRINKWKIEKASDELIKYYEEFKKEFTENLNKELYETLKMRDEGIKDKDKSEDFLRIKQIYEDYGENYVKMMAEMPHLGVRTLERYISLLKRSLKALPRPMPHT